MKKQYVHISVIFDRTGSVESIRDDTSGGFNAFLREQKKAPGAATPVKPSKNLTVEGIILPFKNLTQAERS